MDVMVNRGYKVIGLWVGLGMVCVLCYFTFLINISLSGIVFTVN